MAEREGNNDVVCEEDWEVVDDGGFVYKRRKRRRASSPPHPPPLPPGNENDFDFQKRRRLLKKATLVKLKAEYEKELREWESLSQMLQRAPPARGNQQSLPSPLPPSSPSQSLCKHLVKELLGQVMVHAEAQEALIQDSITLCNAAELMCHAHETDLKQAIIDLPVWETPLTVVHNMSPSDSEENA